MPEDPPKRAGTSTEHWDAAHARLAQKRRTQPQGVPIAADPFADVSGVAEVDETPEEATARRVGQARNASRATLTEVGKLRTEMNATVDVVRAEVADVRAEVGSVRTVVGNVQVAVAKTAGQNEVIIGMLAGDQKLREQSGMIRLSAAEVEKARVLAAIEERQADKALWRQLIATTHGKLLIAIGIVGGPLTAILLKQCNP